MPTVGLSIDRRTMKHLRACFEDSSVKGLVCMCCAQIHRCSDSTNGEIGYVSACNYFDLIVGSSFEANWDFAAFMTRYGSTPALSNHAEMIGTTSNWKRRCGFGKWHNRTIICCPEDVRCFAAPHNREELCAQCEFPLCRKCKILSSGANQEQNSVPAALANDNFFGFPTELIYKWKVRWIEAAAASPVFTCLITYYVEGDRGH